MPAGSAAARNLTVHRPDGKTSAKAESPEGGRYIAADPVDWDYAPKGVSEISGEPFNQDEDVFVGQGEHRGTLRPLPQGSLQDKRSSLALLLAYATLRRIFPTLHCQEQHLAGAGDGALEGVATCGVFQRFQDVLYRDKSPADVR